VIFALNLVGHDKSFNSVLLDKNIDTCLSDSHDDSLHHSCMKRLSLEELEGVELNTCLRCKLSKSVLAVHLVTLLGHLELVCHII